MAVDAPNCATGSVHEVEFSFQESEYPFVTASDTAGCRVELAEMIPRANSRYAEYFNVTGTDPDRILALTAEVDTIDGSLLVEYEDGGLFEFLVSGNCPALTLAELGALPRRVEGEEGKGRIVAEIPPRCDPSTVIGTFLAETPNAELTGKREREDVTPLLTQSVLEQVLHARLTDRQREVIRAAFEAGYYEWPRECTGEDVAKELGITSATVSEHLHAAERKLITLMFGETR